MRITFLILISAFLVVNANAETEFLNIIDGKVYETTSYDAQEICNENPEMQEHALLKLKQAEAYYQKQLDNYSQCVLQGFLIDTTVIEPEPEPVISTDTTPEV